MPETTWLKAPGLAAIKRVTVAAPWARASASSSRSCFDRRCELAGAAEAGTLAPHASTSRSGSDRGRARRIPVFLSRLGRPSVRLAAGGLGAIASNAPRSAICPALERSQHRYRSSPGREAARSYTGDTIEFKPLDDGPDGGGLPGPDGAQKPGVR